MPKALATSPHTTPVAYRPTMMATFSRGRRFVRTSTSRPTPADTRRPASMAPDPSTPSTYSCAMTTLAAQLGTRPTSADPNTQSAGFAARNSASTSSPTTSNTAFSTMVMTKMKTVTCNVCFTALLRMPPSPSWQWQW